MRSEALRQVIKQQLKLQRKILYLGSHNSLVPHDMCSNFFSLKNHSTLLASCPQDTGYLYPPPTQPFKYHINWAAGWLGPTGRPIGMQHCGWGGGKSCNMWAYEGMSLPERPTTPLLPCFDAWLLLHYYLSPPSLQKTIWFTNKNRIFPVLRIRNRPDPNLFAGPNHWLV